MEVKTFTTETSGSQVDFMHAMSVLDGLVREFFQNDAKKRLVIISVQDTIHKIHNSEMISRVVVYYYK